MDEPQISMSDILRRTGKGLPAERDPLLADRETTHGAFSITALIAQQLKYTYRKNTRSQPNSAQYEALDMIATKIARILSGDPNTRDHWADIAGYAKLGEEACG